MTLQEVYDKVAIHLLTQSKRSVVPAPERKKGYNCAYRGKDGLKCAVGCLIPDDQYKPEMEGSAVYSLYRHFPESLEHLQVVRVHHLLTLLAGLQMLHDSHSPEEWPDRLVTLADSYGLNSDVVTNFNTSEVKT